MPTVLEDKLVLPVPKGKCSREERCRILKVLQNYVARNKLPYRITGLKRGWPAVRKPSHYNYTFTMDLGSTFEPTEDGDRTMKQMQVMFPGSTCELCISSEANWNWAVSVKLRYKVQNLV